MHASVVVNGVQVTANASFTILQLCTLLGVYIPRFCYHEKLSIVGSCRMCLVEMHKAFKPIVACATPLLTGMNIRTETALVRNSREHILEFLLINHPLDCPICDQGGECDLQDQALIYGSDRGRFKEKKRSVSNKDLGPFIKTIMTRCIHCTRCVRFMSEIANDNMLGTLGRGKDMEIGTYISTQIGSEISGNIIDICPVGALTSKPFAFAARSWELRSVESIDIFDGLGSSIRLDFRGSEVVRVLPKTNESINEQWITNKIRFAYDGFKYQRLTMPLLRKGKWCTSNRKQQRTFYNISWERVMKLINITLLYYLLVYTYHSVQFNVGKLIDVNSICALARVIALLGLQPIVSQVGWSKDYNNIDFRYSYILNKPIVHFERSGAYIFLGSNPQMDAPLLNTRLFKKSRTKKLIGFFGSRLKDPNYSKQLGVNTDNLIRITEGRHFFCNALCNFREISWISSSIDRNSAFFLLNTLPNVINKVHSFNILHDNCTQIGILDLGLTRIQNESTNWVDLVSNNQFYYNIGIEHNDAVCMNGFIVYQSHHNICSNIEDVRYNIVLPSSSFIEKTRFHINVEGRLLSTRKAVASPGFAKEDLDIINILGLLFRLNTTRDLSNMLLRFLMPHLFVNLAWRSCYLYSFVWYLYYIQRIVSTNVWWLAYVYNNIYTYAIDSYYKTNLIVAASKILSKYTVVLSNYTGKY